MILKNILSEHNQIGCFFELRDIYVNDA